MKTDNLSEKAHTQLRRLGYVAAAHSLPEIAFLRLAHVAAYQHHSSIEKQQYNEPQQ